MASLPAQHALSHSSTLPAACPHPGTGYALFGSATDGDVLKNLTARFVASLVPVPAAHALVYGIATAFSFNLLVNFVLKVGAASTIVILETMVGASCAGGYLFAARPGWGMHR